MVCKVGTIGEVHQCLVCDGYRVTEYALRKWIQEGMLPAVRSGKKFYITYAHVVELLTTGRVELHPTTALS